jgi:DNA polymerase
MNALKLDFETRSDVDLLKRGAYIYVESRHTDALLASYRIGDGPLRRWTRGQPCPDDIRAHVTAGGVIKAHNAAFERLIWWHIMHARHGWPKPELKQFVCTAVTAAAQSLPRSLDRLGEALDLSVKKDKKGKALIRAHSVPQGWIEAGEPIWNEDPAGLAEFHDYCDVDVITEEEADKRLVPLSDAEQAVYVLNETINDRGLRIDVKSARAALIVAEKAKEKINAELKQVTAGAITAVTQAAAMKRWIEAQGIVMPTLDKETVEEFLHDVDDLPDRVRRVLELRQEGAKPSVEKIAAMLDRVCADGRARGVYLHHGAGQTGRFSSRGVQAHNMPKYRDEFEAAKLNLERLFENIRSGDPEQIELMYGPILGRPLHILSDAVRSFIWAAPGHDLIDVDYTSIEGVLAAWFAKEDWKLDAFRALIAGTGPGMYELFAARGIYNIDVKAVTKIQRRVGKVGELSMGYQGGVGALAKMARANKLKLNTVYPSVWESASDERRESAEGRYEERIKKHDATAIRLGREGWIAGELVKVGWRGAHAMISAAWGHLKDAATLAVTEPGITASALGVKYRVAHGFLWCQLPSGRCLAYGRPKMQEVEAPWADKTLEQKKRETTQSITVLGVDSQTEKWVRFPIYGGSLFNNVVQGSARDILVHGMQQAESAGYPIVLHTHDEMAAEVPRGWGSVEELSAAANTLPSWCLDLPLKASGWRGKRYRKD